jgi:hypothetical protein
MRISEKALSVGQPGYPVVSPITVSGLVPFREPDGLRREQPELDAGHHQESEAGGAVMRKAAVSLGLALALGVLQNYGLGQPPAQNSDTAASAVSGHPPNTPPDKPAGSGPQVAREAGTCLGGRRLQPF